MNSQLSRPLSLASIQLLATRAAHESGTRVLLAGTPAAMPPPDGMADILGRSGQSNLGVAGGLTLTKSAAAFTAPSFSTTPSFERTGYQVRHYAVINRIASADATHESFYPLRGNHLRPGMTQQIQGRTFHHYWVISQRISELIRQGEQEHLDDTLRAYELTYKRIENDVNTLAGQRFGPASNPAAATRLALAALAARLPRQLGTDPANWVRVLDRLLGQTQSRDTNGWHALSIDPPQTSGQMILHPVVSTSTTRVGQVPSSQVVNL